MCRKWEYIQDVSRLNDQAPSGPDEAGSCESGVLSDGELLYWAVEIGDTCEDDCPLVHLSASFRYISMIMEAQCVCL